jgi:all-trans-8'-apo-beta-carotenal 15,15'-oxygenase
MQVACKSCRLAGAAFGMFHDFLVTENYYILLENPLFINVWRLLTQYTRGNACIAECLDFQPHRPMKVRKQPQPGICMHTCSLLP